MIFVQKNQDFTKVPDGKKCNWMTSYTHKHNYSCDHVKISILMANHVKNLTWIMPSETRDRVEKSRIAARHLKNLAGDTQNINESKINLDS